MGLGSFTQIQGPEMAAAFVKEKLITIEGLGLRAF